MPKAKNNTVAVNRITRSAIPVGNDVFEIRRTDDNKGVLITAQGNTLFIPNGSVGRTILNEATSYLTDEPKVATNGKATGEKRVRRTAEQIAAGLTVEDVKAGRTVPAAKEGEANS